jgi:murein L,D-transpeptidase YcbB/YkuD
MMNPDMYNAATGAQFHNAFMSGKDQKAARKLASQAQGGDRHAMDQIRHDSGLPPGVNDKAKRIAQFAMHVLHQQNRQNVPPGVPPAPPAPFGRHHHHRHWDRSAGASDIDVVTVQQWLSRLNLIPFFGITGQYDALTRQAIRSFQSARGLPANGILDDRTAALLAQAARAAQGASQTTSGFGLYSPPRQNIPLEPIIGPPWR